MTQHPSEEMRYEAVLGQGDMLIDCGAYRGKFIREMKQRYNCLICGFEPIKEFYDEWAHGGIANIAVNAALGGWTRREMFGRSADASGMFNLRDPVEVEVQSIREVMWRGQHQEVAFMEVNIEGGEYELLEALFATGLIHNIRTLQVQFHSIVPDCGRRFRAIHKQLLVTHNEQWGEKWWFHRFERK